MCLRKNRRTLIVRVWQAVAITVRRGTAVLGGGVDVGALVNVIRQAVTIAVKHRTSKRIGPVFIGAFVNIIRQSIAIAVRWAAIR